MTAGHKSGDGTVDEQPDQAAKTSPIEEIPDEEGSDDKPDAAIDPSSKELESIPQTSGSHEQKSSESTEEDLTPTLPSGSTPEKDDSVSAWVLCCSPWDSRAAAVAKSSSKEAVSSA